MLAMATGGAARAAVQEMRQVPQQWQGVTRVSVACLVVTDRGVDAGTLHRALCRTVRDAASAEAPVPVAVVGVGDRSLLAADAVTLLVHASVDVIDGRRIMALAIRPFRAGRDDPGTTFGAAPRAIGLAPDGQDQPALARAVRAMLAATLPWQRAPAGHRLPTDHRQGE